MNAILSLDPLTIVLGSGVCFAAAALGSVAGMGAGLIVTLFITPIIGAKNVLPVISVLMLINNASRVWFFREALVPRHVLLVSAAAIPMSAIGAVLYVRLDGSVVQALLGTVLILSIPIRRWLSARLITPTTTQVVAVSGLFGFLSSIIVGAGMLVIPILMGFGLAGPALLSTDAAIAVLVNIAKVIFYGRLDALPLEMFVLAVAMGLCTIPGTWAGAWIVRRTPIRLHTAMIEGLIVIGGCSLIWNSLQGSGS